MAWFEINQNRFKYEISLLKKRFPNARRGIQDGRFTIYLKIIGRSQIFIARIIYPDNFPYQPPKAYIINPKLVNLYEPIHRFCDGSLCLAKSEEINLETSGKDICDWVKDWVIGYEIWLKTGKFPRGR